MLGNLQEEHHSHLNMGTITKGKVKKSLNFLSDLILFVCWF